MSKGRGMPKGTHYVRHITKLKAGSRANTIIKVLSGKNLSNFLRENIDLIQTRYNKQNISPKKQAEMMKEYGMPIYTRKQFTENFKVSMPNMTLEEINDWYDKYELFRQSVVTGTESERKFDMLIENYRMAAEQTGDTYIIDRVNIILDQARDKVLEMMKYQKSDKKKGMYRNILPNIGQYYPLQEGYEKLDVISIVDDLNTIIRDFGLSQPDDNYIEFKYDIDEQIQEELDYDTQTYMSFKKSTYTVDDYTRKARFSRSINKISRDVGRLYNRMSKSQKLKLAQDMYGVVIDTLDVQRVEQAYVTTHFKGRYNKKGQPYIPFVKSSIVRKYIKDK